jgi:hypothetical protein
MDKGQSVRSKRTHASWILASTTDGRDAINLGMEGMNLMMNFISLNHEIFTPARSGNKGSKVFASAGGFPERSR